MGLALMVLEEMALLDELAKAVEDQAYEVEIEIRHYTNGHPHPQSDELRNRVRALRNRIYLLRDIGLKV